MRIGFVLLLALCGFLTRLSAAAETPPADSILCEFYEEIGGTTVVNLTESQNYPDFPTTVQYLKEFEIPSNRSDNYGTRVRGYITAPESGAYTFWIAADDCGELWLSTSEDPAAKKKIAQTTQWTMPRGWDSTPSQKSEPITLEKGRKYYIEALHKEMGGGDCLAVAWQLPSGVKEAPIPGNRLSPSPAPKIVPLASFPVKLTVTTPPPTSPGFHILKGIVNWRDKDFPVACYLFLQKEYFAQPEKKFPIISSLHNVVFAIGGSDGNEGVISEGIALLMRNDIGADARHTGEWPAVRFNPKKEVQFIGVVPQCPKNFGFQFMPMSSVVVEWINWVEKNYRADPERTYLTGYSYSGSCTWAVATQFPDRFAAIAPFSARVGPALEKTPEIMKDVGVWCAVGELDGEFRQACEKMNEFFVAAKHPNYHFTVVKGGGHQCYQSVYANEEFWKWLLAQKRKVR